MNLASMRTDDVVIGRLTIKDPAGAADRVTRELTLAAWPRARGRSWVFIRRVHAEAPCSQLGRAVSAAARRILDGAAGDDLVMRFSSLQALLAQLLTDLAAGCASRRWYWRRWAPLLSLPVGRALIELMTDHVVCLPAVTAELARMKTLADVWLRLDRPGAAGLMEVVARRNGFEWMSGSGADAAMKTTAEELAVPEFIRTRWAPGLEKLEFADPRRDLALMLIGQEIFPLMMLRRPLMLFQQLSQALGHLAPSDAIRPQGGVPQVVAAEAIAPTQLDRQPAQEPAAPGIRSIEAAATRMPTSESAEAAAHHPAPSDADQTTGYRLLEPDAVPGQPRQEQAEGVDQEQATARREKDDTLTTEVQSATGPEAAWEPAPSVTVRPPGTSLDSSIPRASERLRPDTHSAVPPLENFITTQGGLFFLLNFLKREEVQLRIQQASPEEGLTSGWGWLYRLGKELALDENDPIAGFLALQMGLDHPEALVNLPPLPAREHLLSLAGQLYSRHGLWQPDLLRLNARVHYTPSHIDLYASLQSVRMPVRLAGLDLDPGWLPWLGRVVRFHYENDAWLGAER